MGKGEGCVKNFFGLLVEIFLNFIDHDFFWIWEVY
jgi:hypothetical protein